MAALTDINMTFFFVSFFVGVILALISIAMGNNLVRVIVFLIGFVPIILGLLGFVPTGSALNMTTQQSVDQTTKLLTYLVNFVVPYLIGVMISNAGGEFIDNTSKQFGRGR
jgi:hypothetical protein